MSTMRSMIRVFFAGASPLLVLTTGSCWPFWSPDLEAKKDDDCALDPTRDPKAVKEACGVFAHAGAAPGGDGTRDNPYASLQEAVNKAEKKRVYACAEGTFPEAVTLRAGIEVIGGFACDADARWTWSSVARSTIQAPPGKVALTLTAEAAGAKVQSFAISAASATGKGGSSIGVAVADIEAELKQVDVTAGNGMDGEHGSTFTAQATAGANAPPGAATNACIASISHGGDPGMTMCDGRETRGGMGGAGGTVTPPLSPGLGQPGANGLPESDPPSTGRGGTLASDNSCWPAGEGAPGKSGEPGAPGDGGRLTLDGQIERDGKDGTAGSYGQGGGGGSGRTAFNICSDPQTSYLGPGASGGGGGAGGCGGRGGAGGKAGGSSLGVVSLGAKLALTDVTVTVGNGGKGGNGAGGQSGGPGGIGAEGGTTPTNALAYNGCRGGNGGVGGVGGPGGGGRGGDAIGVVYASSPEIEPTLARFSGGTAGKGGRVGPGTPVNQNARDGTVVAVLFGVNTDGAQKTAP